jgi:hypothetical protein
MAQPAQAQPDEALEGDPSVGARIPDLLAPDQHVLNGFEVEVRPGPTGGRFLVVHCFNRGEMLLMDFSDDRQAEQLAGELMPSRVVVPGDSGIVLP